jgi:3-methylfumaryl-CoA hydratase
MTQIEDWIGQRADANDICALPLVRRLGAALDVDTSLFKDGDTLPFGWHIVLFSPTVPQHELGSDGHPKLGSFMPLIPRARRMFAGRRLQFVSPIIIGAPVRRVSEVVSVQRKNGRTGELIIVTVRQSIYLGDATTEALIEDQDIIYRLMDGPRQVIETGTPPKFSLTPTVSRSLVPDTTLLFRFSAATFNAHRVHYDLPYTQSQEGYPGLLVNASVTASALLDLFRDNIATVPKTYSVRNVHPLFCNRKIELHLAPYGDGWKLWALNDHGHLAQEAEIT